jgi:hypothetical protein
MMVSKILLGIAAATMVLEIVVIVLGNTGFLGYGDTCFIRAVLTGGVLAMIAIVTGIVTSALYLNQRLSCWVASTAVVLCIFTVVIFLRKLLG